MAILFAEIHRELSGGVMNPRRVHELMRQHFPPTDAASRTWKHIVGPEGLQKQELLCLLDEFIPAEHVLVEIRRKLGDYLCKNEAITFAAAHLGEGEIRITDRDFRGFVVIGHNGVATGWSSLSNTAVNRND